MDDGVKTVAVGIFVYIYISKGKQRKKSLARSLAFISFPFLPTLHYI